MSVIVQCYGRPQPSTESSVGFWKRANSNLGMDLAVETELSEKKLARVGSEPAAGEFQLGGMVEFRVLLRFPVYWDHGVRRNLEIIFGAQRVRAKS